MFKNASTTDVSCQQLLCTMRPAVNKLKETGQRLLIAH